MWLVRTSTFCLLALKIDWLQLIPVACDTATQAKCCDETVEYLQAGAMEK
jgi:hypothetical protein